MTNWQRLKFVIVCSTFSVCAAGVFIRPAAPRRIVELRPADLYSVVMNELNAVRQADYVSAYRHVSLSMQERYNLDAFSEYVRTEHPDLVRFQRVEFGPVRAHGTHASVPAYVFLPNDEIVTVQYSFVREEGAWRIDGSQVQRRWSRGFRVGGSRI